MTYYRYRSFSIIAFRLLGHLIFLPLCLLLTPAGLAGLYEIIQTVFIRFEMISLEMPGVALLITWLVFLLGCLIAPNLYPDLAVDDRGLYVRFYFRWLFVPWENVVSFHQSAISTLNPFSQKKSYFLLARHKLTPIHWLISFNQLGGWGPGFLILSSISDYNDLVRMIRAHVAHS